MSTPGSELPTAESDKNSNKPAAEGLLVTTRSLLFLAAGILAFIGIGVFTGDDESGQPNQQQLMRDARNECFSFMRPRVEFLVEGGDPDELLMEIGVRHPDYVPILFSVQIWKETAYFDGDRAGSIAATNNIRRYCEAKIAEAFGGSATSQQSTPVTSNLVTTTTTATTLPESAPLPDFGAGPSLRESDPCAFDPASAPCTENPIAKNLDQCLEGRTLDERPWCDPSLFGAGD